MDNKKYNDSDIKFLKTKVCEIFKNTKELEQLMGRHFTIDGHLAGSIGEVYASYYYGIDLDKAGKKTHDGTKDGKKVQIKMTQRNSVDIKGIPEYLIVLKFDISEEEVVVYEVYNGPGEFLKQYKRNSNNEISISLNKLSEHFSKVSIDRKICTDKPIKKYEHKGNG